MKKKILVADDSATIHKVVSLTLAGENVSVEGVASGDAAWEKVRSDRPALVLADVSMPGIGGYDLCARIKSDSNLAWIPVVLLVGSRESFDEDRAAGTKCNGHLRKPFASDELIGVVRKLVKGEDAGAQVAQDPPLVSRRTKESFLGSSKILDVFGVLLNQEPSAVSDESESASESVESGMPVSAIPLSPVSAGMPAASPASGQNLDLSEQALDSIVEKVVRRMSREVVREVAWEVIPELADIAIREWLKENYPPGSGVKPNPAR